MSKRPEKTINKNTAKTAKRLLKYVTDTYKLQFILVFVCIFISAAASDRKSTRLNSSHRCISYAVFCLKKKKKKR